MTGSVFIAAHPNPDNRYELKLSRYRQIRVQYQQIRAQIEQKQSYTGSVLPLIGYLSEARVVAQISAYLGSHPLQSSCQLIMFNYVKLSTIEETYKAIH